jgi:hypothetical protein
MPIAWPINETTNTKAKDNALVIVR